MYPFEIHLTTATLSPDRLAVFIDACHYLQAKPLLIELAQGTCRTQPMLSKVVQQPSLASALTTAAADAAYLQQSRLPVTRTKIETPATLYQLATSAYASYFEWHGKVSYQQVDELLTLYRQHRVHLSTNALKKEPTTRFVTLRAFGTYNVFQKRVIHLVTALRAQWQLVKQESECCLYDSNAALDAGWLPR